MSDDAINIGIYGCTKAGKTRFLFQLLNYWDKNHRLLEQSEACHKFLTTVRAELQTHGEAKPTVARTEGIRVKVQRDGNEPPLQLVFCDLRGELLADELDQIESLKRDGVVPTQVRQCDAFLFFFDPASSEKPDQLEAHHRRELKRAQLFIDYVFKVRENRHLPIIFVLTHFDRWQADRTIRDMAERWIGDVHAHLRDVYHSGLRRFHPKSLVDRERVAFSVSSIGEAEDSDKQLENVVYQLSDLVADARKHWDRLRKSGLYGLIFAIAAFAGLLIAACVMRGCDVVPPEDGNGDIDRIVGELEDLLNKHPPGNQLPSVEDAQKINEHLKKLVWRLNPSSGGTKDLREDLVKRMRAAVEKAAAMVRAKAQAKNNRPAELAPVLSAYLRDLGDTSAFLPEIAEAQDLYWDVQRESVVEQLSNILRRRSKVGSAPVDTLREVMGKLRNFENEVSQCKVFAPRHVRRKLVEDIKTAATFCEDRIKTSTYPIKLRIGPAYLDRKDSWLRTLLVKSPGQDDSFSRDGIFLRPEITAERTEFTTKQPEYDLNLGLGTPVKMVLMVYQGKQEDGKHRWAEVKAFDLTEKREDCGPLLPLGLPLHKREGVKKPLQADGYHITVTLSGVPPVPDLLWEAARLAEEPKP